LGSFSPHSAVSKDHFARGGNALSWCIDVYHRVSHARANHIGQTILNRVANPRFAGTCYASGSSGIQFNALTYRSNLLIRGVRFASCIAKLAKNLIKIRLAID
jgi:hypothetical protein